MAKKKTVKKKTVKKKAAKKAKPYQSKVLKQIKELTPRFDQLLNDTKRLSSDPEDEIEKLIAYKETIDEAIESAEQDLEDAEEEDE